MKYIFMYKRLNGYLYGCVGGCEALPSAYSSVVECNSSKTQVEQQGCNPGSIPGGRIDGGGELRYRLPAPVAQWISASDF